MRSKLAIGLNYPFIIAAIGHLLAGVEFRLLVPGITSAAMRDVAGPATDAASGRIVTRDLRYLPPQMQATASNAFGTGYHIALRLCLISFLSTVWLSARAFKQTKLAKAVAAKEPRL